MKLTTDEGIILFIRTQFHNLNNSFIDLRKNQLYDSKIKKLKNKIKKQGSKIKKTYKK